MDSTAEPVAVEFPEKSMPTPLDTSTTSIPTPEASATTTSAKKKKKKKKKKSKSGSEAGSLSASTPTSPAIGPDEEDEEISGPPTPSDSTEDNNSNHNLPPTPLSASGVLPLMEETPEAVAIEEAATVPAAVAKDERTEDEPAKMEVVPILEEEPTVDDDHGVARTIMNALPEDDDDEMTDQTSSEDETDQHMLYSFADDPRSSYDSFASRGDARDEIRSFSNAHLSMGSDKVARISRAPPPLDPRLTGYDPQSTIRRARGETLTSNNTDATNGGNAQQALRALMQDRSRSASSHASSSSMQFHSSPPMPHAHLGGYNASPTTITDPDLATPSTDTGSHGSSDATRCVCNSSSPDGNIMIQCDSCSKWLHAKCVGLTNRNIPDLYVCTYCEQTPMRGGTIRATARQTSFRQSPLAHKSNQRR